MNRRRAILVLAGLALIWAAAVVFTGGFVIDTPWRRISSRDALRPLAAGIGLLLFYAVRFRRHLADDVAPLAGTQWPAAIAVVAGGATLMIGLALGTDIAGGPDASGFVSQAALFAEGRLARSAPAWAIDAPWNDPTLASSPVGYRPARDTRMLAPTYPPGLSMIMAAVQIVAGPSAVFLVVPAMGALAIWATFLLGARVAGQWEGAMASVLLLCSPTFLTMLLQPMSDVPATACWTLALVAALRRHAAAAGVATAVAVLVRPNLVPAALIPALLLFRVTGRMREAVVFACTVAPAAAIIAGLNSHYYGSPLQSGYGSLSYLYASDRIVPNAIQYGRWLVMTQTPLVALWLLAPFSHRGSPARLEFLLVTVGFSLAVLGLYLPYLQFQAFEWWYLRFLLPAYPCVLIGVAAVVVTAARRIPFRAVAFIGSALLTAAVCWHGWNVAGRAEMLDRKRGDQRYARAVAFVQRLPRDAVIVSLAHSGTISLYTGRDVLRFEAIERGSLDLAVAHLRGIGRGVYFVGDLFEVELLRDWFRGSATLEALDAGPVADLGGAVVYEL